MLSRRTAPLLALFLSLLPSPAPASAARPTSERLCRELPALNVSFRFGTGSPPVGIPAVAPDGAIYVGTREGYVHALHADGSYHWSYTVQGSVTGRPGLAASGVVLVPTPRRIYAIRPDGSLLWTFNSPVRVRGDLVRDGRGRMHFASEDGRVFALSTLGALVGHIPGKVRLSALPVALPDGAIAAGREDGSVVISENGRTSRFKLDGAITAILGCPGARACAIAGGVLRQIGASSGAEFAPAAVRAAENGEFMSVVSSDDRLQLFRGSSRERLFERALPQPASAAPLIDSEGTTYVPLRNGALYGVSRDGRVSACVALASSPLGTPVLDAPRKRLIVTASEGMLASVELP